MTPNFPNDNYPKNFQEIKYCFTCKDHLPISHLHKDVPVNETDEGMEVYKKYAKEPQYSPLGAAIESLRCDLHDLFMRVNDLQELRYNHDKIIEHMNTRVKFLEEHHTRQIDENRKISRRVDDIVGIELQLARNQFVAAFDRIEKLEQITTISNYKEFIDDMTCRIDQIDKYECHNRALIDELKKPEYSAIEFRLQKLEQEKVIYKQNTIDDIHNRMTFIENNAASKENVADAFTQLRDNTNERLRILEQMHTENVYKPIESGKKPHKCPVCDGCGNSKGQVEQNPNYEFCMKYASCNSCEGKGVLWG